MSAQQGGAERVRAHSDFVCSVIRRLVLDALDVQRLQTNLCKIATVSVEASPCRCETHGAIVDKDAEQQRAERECAHADLRAHKMPVFSARVSQLDNKRRLLHR